MLNTQYQTIHLSPVLDPGVPENQLVKKQCLKPPHIDIFSPCKKWLDAIDIQNPKLAKLIAKLIPAQCPFERDIVFFGRKIAHIPPLCKLNPLYEQFFSLRFRALCYLVDQCGEDIQSYC